MSVEFVKLISELHNQKYLNQARQIAERKIPCGFFYGFRLPEEENFEQAVNILRNAGFNLTCICVIDDVQKQWLEEKFSSLNLDVSVFRLDELPTLQAKPSIILYRNVSHTACFKNYFDKYGVNMLGLSDARMSEQGYSFFMDHLSDLWEVHEMFDEEESKKVFRAFTKGRITQRIEDFRFAPEPQYFLDGFLPTEGDIAIDGGSYDGATSRDFAMQGAKVYAFEMNAENYKNCLTRAEKYNFTIENLGLSDKTERGYYLQGGGAGSHRVSGGGVASDSSI